MLTGILITINCSRKDREADDIEDICNILEAYSLQVRVCVGHVTLDHLMLSIRLRIS